MRTMDDGNRLDTRSRGRRLWAVGVFLTVFLCLLCGAGLAESKIQAEMQTWIPDEDVLAGQDEWFTGYLQQLMYGDYGISLFGVYGQNSLDGINRVLYDALKIEIEKIAAGERANTAISISVSSLNLTKTSFTMEELGYTEALPIADSQEAINKATEKLGYDHSAIFYAILADCPYEMYWYNKEGVRSQAPFQAWNDGTNVTRVDINMEGSFTFYFPVSQRYADTSGSYLTDITTTSAAANSVKTAQSIVAAHEGKSDYEKLLAYKNEICELVSYNHDAAANPNTSDRDPWQLVYVFDNDPATNVVCEGYAKAFQYLCDLSDIPCYSVSGEMDGGSGAGAHMWNIVTLNGKQYLVDVTNCDDGTIGSPNFLFLKAYTSSSSTTVQDDDGYSATSTVYTFSANGQNITFTYDYNTVTLYDSDILTLASEDYTQPQPTALTINTVSIASKPYDGKTDATVTGVTFMDANSNVVNLTKDTDYTVTAAFEEANVGTSKTVTGTVTLTDTGSQKYTLENGAFTTTGEITKATQPTPVAPTVSGTTADSITVQTVAGQKYICTTSSTAPATNDSGWVEATDSTHIFTGLSASTTYYVYTYIPSNTNYEDSPVSEGTSAQTTEVPKTPLSDEMFTITSPVTYTGAGQSATINTTLTLNTDYTVSYTVSGTGALDENHLPKGAGMYTVTLTGIGDYSGNVTYTLTINPATLTASADGVTVTKTYDGTTGAGTLQGDVTLTGQVSGDDVSVTATPGAYDSVDAGDKSVTLTLALVGEDAVNYTLGSDTLTVSGSITPASPSIAWTSGTQTVPYTGSAVSITPPTVTLVNGETFGGTINYQYQAQGATEWTDGLPSNVGTYDVRASIAAAGNYTDATTATNLTLTISAGVLAQPAVTLDSDAPGKLTATWGEVEHATDYSVQLDGGEAVTATDTSHTFDITSAGSHTVTVTATDSSGNYTSNAGSASATFHSVAWMNDGQAYASTQLCISGSKLTEPTAPVKPYYTFAGWTVDGVAWNFETDTVTQDVTLTAAWTEVGAVTVENVTFETQPYGYAQPEAKNLVITVPDGSQVDSVTISDTSKFNLVSSGSTYNVQPIVGLGAGTHTATITVTYNGGKAATAQVSFEVTKAAQGTPDAPTVVSESTTASSVTLNTIAGQRYIITTSATAPEKTAEGWVTAESSTYTFTGLSASTTYFVYTYIPGGENREDSDVSASATVTTAAPAPTDLTADMFTVSASKTYTAQEQAADIATDLSADAYTVRYSAQTGALGESGLPLDAGTYIVTITANEGSGYTGSVPYTMTIAPATVTITPVEASWTFGQTVPELTYTTNLIAGSALATAFDSAKDIALTFGGDGYAGTYAITASALDAGGNFTLTLDNSKVVTINPAAQTLTAAGPLSLTVGQSVSLTGHVTSDRSAAISYAVVSGGASISGDTLTASAVGTATVKASASAVDVNGDGAPEYSAAETTFDITVLAKATDETTMTLDVQSVTYGESIAPNVSGKPGDAGDIAFSYSGTTAGGSSYASSAAPTQAGSYTVTARCESATTVYTAQTSFEIKPKLVTIAEVTADDKTYDGLMSTNGGLRLEGAADGEELMLGTDFTAELAFDDPNAGENKTVTLTVTLHNPNYTFEGGAIGEAKTTATITKADDTPVKPILVVEGGSLSVSNVKFGCLYMILPKSATPPTAESNGWVGMSSDCEIIFDGLTSGEEYVIYAYMPETANTKESAVVASDPVLVRAQAQAPQRPVVSATATGASVRFTSAAANQMYMILPQGASAPTAESAGWQAVPASGMVSLEGLTPGEYVVYTYVPAADGVAASAVVVSDAVRVNAPAQMPVASVVGGTTQIIAEPGTQGVLAVEPVEGATYQWYINRGDGKGYVAIDGATQPTYTTTPVNAGNDGFTYYCEVTNAAGTARSAILTLHVRQIPQTGDASRPMLWAALLLAGLGVLLALRPSRRGNAAR